MRASSHVAQVPSPAEYGRLGYPAARSRLLTSRDNGYAHAIDPNEKLHNLDLLPPPFNVFLALGILVVPGAVLAWLAFGARAWGGPWLGAVPGLVLGGICAFLADSTATDLGRLLAANPARMTTPWRDSDAAILALVTVSLAFAAVGTSSAALFGGERIAVPALVWLIFAACLAVVMFPLGMPLVAALILGRLTRQWLALSLLALTLAAIVSPFAHFGVRLPWSLLAADCDRRATIVALTAWLLLAVALTASRMANWPPRDQAKPEANM